MPVCRQCEKPFPCRVHIDGKIRNLKNRKFCLSCSPFGAHNTKNLALVKIKTGKQCQWHLCRKPLTGNQTHFCSRICNLKDKVTKRRRELKTLSVEYKGGGCSRCGYARCISALEFHHLDPNKKDFNPSSDGHTRSWERTRAELDKCLIVCANCHREIHHELQLQREAG